MVDIDASIVTDQYDVGGYGGWASGPSGSATSSLIVLRKEFNIPEHAEPVNILALGYPAGQAAHPTGTIRPAKPLQDTVSYESF